MLEVVVAQGLAAAPGALLARLFAKGMLGVSLNNHVFSKGIVREITELGLGMCQEFCIIIFDYPERYNWPFKTGVTIQRYEAQCLRIGQEKKHSFERMLRTAGYSNQVSIITWQEGTADKRYTRNLATLSRLFANDRHFYAQVLRQVRTNLSGKIAAAEHRNDRPFSDSELESLCHYLLEEIAGLLYFQFDLGYQIDIYPGKQMRIMELIYDQRFPALAKQLAYPWTQQGWVQVRQALGNTKV